MVMTVEDQRNAQRFVGLEPERRASSIETTREHLRLTDRKLAAKLVAHAAGLLAEAFAGSRQARFRVSSMTDERDTVEILGLLASDGRDFAARTDSRLDIDAVGEAETLLAEASNLGVDFKRSPDHNGSVYLLALADPLDGVRLHWQD